MSSIQERAKIELALAGMGTWSPGASHMLNSEDGQKNRAAWAYAQADAMLEARKA